MLAICCITINIRSNTAGPPTKPMPAPTTIEHVRLKDE